MPLPTGSRLGSYEIVAPLGAGGMGAVFHARDTRLGRSVAIKVILETFASDGDRIARFEREARMLAALNHPRIASLYGLEQADGRHFLVMELIEGETIADRLRRGAMPVEDALAIGLQIAEALEAAHEKGVVHRDLKPANVKITPEQQVKVLDFGLAKAMENDAHPADVANSPTLSMMATQAGVILGTAAYMSPEQAKGFPADHRSDVFSFGSVLFEMLTGRQPFQGDTAPEVLASVLVREPELSGLPADLNPRVVDLIKRCLEKSPKKRWQHIGDVRAELESLAAAPRSIVMSAMQAPLAPFWKRVLVPAAVTLIAAAATGWTAWSYRPVEPKPVVRVEMQLPQGQTWAYMGRNVIALSPDGARLAYVSGNKLFVREMADFAGALVPGAAAFDVLSGPSFSPDGRFLVAYVSTDQMLKKIPVGGGAPINICQTANPMGLHWADDGWMYFAAGAGSIFRVSENGGKPEELFTLTAQERAHGVTRLPDGKTLLLAIARGSLADRWDTAQVVVVDLATKERKVLLEGAADPRLLPTGHLAYAHKGIIYAVPFDLRKLEVTGPAVPILEGVRRAPGNAGGGAHFTFTQGGLLAYLDGPAVPDNESEMLVQGGAGDAGTPLNLPAGTYWSPRVSRDGRQLVFQRTEGTESLYIYNLDGQSAIRRLTFEGRSFNPLFTPDGRHVVFNRDSDNTSDRGLYWTRADGTGGLERLTKSSSGEHHIAESWSPDGRTLLYSSGVAARWTLWSLSIADRSTRQVSAATGVAALGATFSPDGKWIAYAVPSGPLHNIYVEPYPATGARFELPRRTGDDPHHPLFSPDGKTLYYTSRPNMTALVPITVSGGTFAFGNSSTYSQPYRTQAPSLPRLHDMLPNGQFIGLGRAGTLTGESASGSIRLVINWFEELRAKLAPR